MTQKRLVPIERLNKFFSQDERVFQFIIEIQKIVDYLVIDDIDFIKTDYADILFNQFKNKRK